jgi:hypothetical protein
MVKWEARAIIGSLQVGSSKTEVSVTLPLLLPSTLAKTDTPFFKFSLSEKGMQQRKPNCLFGKPLVPGKGLP